MLTRYQETASHFLFWTLVAQRWLVEGVSFFECRHHAGELEEARPPPITEKLHPRYNVFSFFSILTGGFIYTLVPHTLQHFCFVYLSCENKVIPYYADPCLLFVVCGDALAWRSEVSFHCTNFTHLPAYRGTYFEPQSWLWKCLSFCVSAPNCKIGNCSDEGMTSALLKSSLPNAATDKGLLRADV